MEERRAEARREAIDATGRVIESAHGAVSRAGAYVQERAGRASERARDLSDRARDLARDAREQIMRVRETPLPSSSGDVRTYLREHPLQAIVAMIAVGYVLGKLVRRA